MVVTIGIDKVNEVNFIEENEVFGIEEISIEDYLLVDDDVKIEVKEDY